MKLKKILGLSAVLLFAAMLFGTSSCQGDPSQYDLFIGKYHGKISYTNTTDLNKSVAPTDGVVTVSKVGKTYSFFFSNNIPEIVGLRFEQKDDDSYAAIGLESTSFIKIKNDELNLVYIKGLLGETWTATNCKKN